MGAINMRILSGLLAGGALLTSGSAIAYEEVRQVGANSIDVIALHLCSPRANFAIEGDGDTDLDYWIYDSRGNEVWNDTSLSDRAYTGVARTVNNTCEELQLRVQNLGNVYNQYTVVVTGDDDVMVANSEISTANRSLRSDANSTDQVLFYACSSQANLRADGDDDTDLDYTIYDGPNSVVFSDVDLTDMTATTLRGASGCREYTMHVANLGNVYNQYEVSFNGSGYSFASQPTAPPQRQPQYNQPIRAGGNSSSSSSSVQRPAPHVQSYRVDANARASLDLNICARMVDIVADGDDDTDLDFFLYGPNGNLVFSDTDFTDVMIYTIDNSGSRGNCQPYRLEVANLGNVYNQYTVTMTDK